jgi:hypothetical protein
VPVANLIEPFASDDDELLALCVWREARGESLAAKVGVVDVVRNRCKMAPAQGFKPTVRENILKPWAFSSFMVGDPNSAKYPGTGDRSWVDSRTAATHEDPDTVDGAVFYYSLPLEAPPKAWGLVEFCVTMGGLHFFKPLPPDDGEIRS